MIWKREILLPKSLISIQQQKLTLSSILESDFSYHILIEKVFDLKKN
jgi:hypothetical protein